jgi:hypothetical protein
LGWCGYPSAPDLVRIREGAGRQQWWCLIMARLSNSSDAVGWGRAAVGMIFRSFGNPELRIA